MQGKPAGTESTRTYWRASNPRAPPEEETEEPRRYGCDPGAWLNRTATQANYFLNGVTHLHADEVKMEALIRVLEESKKEA